MAPGYDYHSALKNRLAAIADLGSAQNSFAQMQAARARAKAQADQQLAMLQAAAQSRGIASQNQAGMSGGFAGSVSSGNASFDKFKHAIAVMESSDQYFPKYPAGNPYNAMGKYSILASALGGTKSGWDYQALGYDVTPQQFMAPEIQEKVATYHLKRLYDRFGPAGAAVAWYAGEGTAAKWVKSNGGGAYNTGQAGGYPSINAYVNKLMKLMG